MSDRNVKLSPQAILLGTANWLARAVLGDHALASRIGGPQFAVTRAGGTSPDGAGGFLVPGAIESAIIAFRDQAVFRSNASVYPISTDTTTIPRRTGGVTASFVAENTALPESALSWDGIAFAAKKLAAFSRFSNELDEDAAAQIAFYFLQDSGAAIGQMEDACGFAGDGTSTFGGMRGICPTLIDGAHGAGAVNAGSGHSTFGQLDTSDISSLMAALPDKYWPNCKFYVSGYGAAQTFARLGATTGGTRLGRPAISFAGIPIVITPKLPGAGSQTGKVMILFGDLSSAAAVGSRTDLILAKSTDRYFDSDQIAYRVTERVDIIAHNLGDNSAAGAVVGLIGA